MEQAKRRVRLTMERIGPLSLRTAYWRADADMGNRPLLFLNGVGANIEVMKGLGEAILDRDVISFDAPGVGGSSTPALPYTPWAMTGWTEALLDQLGLEDVDVMGFSWGGALAQQFAFQYPRRVGRLILAAASPGVFSAPGRLSSLLKLFDPRRRTDPEAMQGGLAALYADEVDETAAARPLAGLLPPSPKGFFFQLTAFAGWSSLPFIRLLDMPALVMAGRRDTIVPVANARILHAGLPNARLHIVEDAGHLFLATKTRECLKVVLDFLDETDAKRGVEAA